MELFGFTDSRLSNQATVYQQIRACSAPPCGKFESSYCIAKARACFAPQGSKFSALILCISMLILRLVGFRVWCSWLSVLGLRAWVPWPRVELAMLRV